MNAGIRGAHNLAWKLAAVHRGEAQEGLLETYGDEQRGTARAVIREMRFNVLELPLPPLALRAVGALMPLSLSSSTVRRWIEHTFSDLGMHYRGSPLSRQRGGGWLPRAGDRAPDVAVLAGGVKTRLRGLLSYRHWTLFLPPGRDEATRRAREVSASFRVPVRIATVAEVGRALGRSDRMMLVRPDGHIGLLARMDDTRELGKYLSEFFAPTTTGGGVGGRSVTADGLDCAGFGPRT
jgi:hypothetical protein